MTELEKYDTNGNGVIDPHELALIELEDRRRKMEDEDAQRMRAILQILPAPQVTNLNAIYFFLANS